MNNLTRALAASVTAALMGVATFGAFICAMRRWFPKGQPVRSWVPEHAEKNGTPTMGGLWILWLIFINTWIWSPRFGGATVLVAAVLLAFGALGAVDDWRKIAHRDTNGVSETHKTVFQGLTAFGAALWMVRFGPSLSVFGPYTVAIPAWIWVFWAAFIIVGTSNAVNLTDGLDGLAIGPFCVVAAVLGAFALRSANPELAVVCGAFVGAGLGFWWFNAPPARIIMGDVGALPLGAGLACVALTVHHEWALALSGIVFVGSVASVIAQTVFRRLFGKKLFLLAPIHHHFQRRGLSESAIATRFLIVTVVASIATFIIF